MSKSEAPKKAPPTPPPKQRRTFLNTLRDSLLELRPEAKPWREYLVDRMQGMKLKRWVFYCALASVLSILLCVGVHYRDRSVSNSEILATNVFFSEAIGKLHDECTALSQKLADAQHSEDVMRQERDKYQVMLAPFEAMALTRFTNGSIDQRLDLLAQSISFVTNALAFAVPNLPYIKIETLNGLPIDGLPNRETNKQYLKLHRVRIRNVGEVEIDNFRSRLQIPEPIISTKEINQSIGTLVGWRSLKIEILTTGTAGRTAGGMWLGPASTNYFLYPEMAFNPYTAPFPSDKGYRGQEVMIAGSGEVSGIWELTIDKLPPFGYASVLFFTSDSDAVTNYTKFADTPLWASPPNPSTIADTNELRFYLEGEYQFQALNKPQKQYFLVPISFDAQSRKISSSEIQTNITHWHPVIIESY